MSDDVVVIADDVKQIELNFADNRLLADLCGEFDRNLAEIEKHFSIQIIRRGNELRLVGNSDAARQAAKSLEQLYKRLESGRDLDTGAIQSVLRMGPQNMTQQKELFSKSPVEIRTRKKTVEPRTQAQKEYVKWLFEKELTFGIGPAGTGKTYLAVAAAANFFVNGMVDKIILSRPAVEAGERLGFLPGDMKDKVDPYMQPLYDALNDFFPAKQLARLIEEKQIEIAPLAFMRGRTLANAFVVLDEAQNATTMQMKMFLTRLGEGSRMAITGDRTQVDLPRGVASGLADAERLLKPIDKIAFSYFTTSDVVRHPLVAEIITAYDKDAEKGDR